MKKVYFIALFIFTILNSKSSFAQLSETTMKDIIDSVSFNLINLEDNLDKEIVNVTIDLLAGTKSEKRIYRYLDNGFNYNLNLIGDRRISELNVEVNRKSSEKWIKVDRIAGNNPQLEIYPDEYSLYEFIINVKSFNEDNTAGHFAFLLYHDDPVKSKKAEN